MPELSVYEMTGEKSGKLKLKSEIWEGNISESILHTALVMQLNNRRKGTASTKTRAEVSGGGRKPYRQKGTGRARHGSIRSPLWKGGGVIFGPKPRNYSYRLPRKMRKIALKSAFLSRIKDNDILVIKKLKIPKPKTKEMVEFMDNLGLKGKVLLILEGNNENVEKSGRNIPYLKIIHSKNINYHDILNFDKIVITSCAVQSIEEALL